MSKPQVPTSKVTTQTAPLKGTVKGENPKCPPQRSKPRVSALNVKTLSAHLKAHNPNCPPQSFEP